MQSILSSGGYEAQRQRLGHQRAAGRLHHAYLISGPEGVGKRDIATELAAGIVCQRPKSIDPCLECDSCRRVEHGNHPDVTVFSLKNQIDESSGKQVGNRLSVDSVRRISAAAAKRPYSSNMSVMIVDDVETMQGPAQEAFLKTLEEPPPYLVLILLADNADMLKPTILSRTERVEFLPIEDDMIARILVERGVPEAETRRISLVSLGRLGWSLAASEDPSMLNERESDLASAASWVTSSPFNRIARAFELTERGSFDGQVVSSRVQSAGHIWREVLLRSAGIASISLGSILDRTALSTTDVRLESAHRALSSVRRCLDDLDANVRPRLALETMVMQWPTISSPRN